MARGESVSTTTDQVKLDVLISVINVSPLYIVPRTSDKPRVEEPTVEPDITTQEKRVDTTNVMPMVKGKGDKEPVNKEASNGFSFSWIDDEDDDRGEEEGQVVASHEEHQAHDMAHDDTDEKRSENEGESDEEKESEAEDNLDEQVRDSGEEEKDSEEEGDSESKGEEE
nr:prostatic spermine-binding protein-like [Nicotiana tomentosiformis]